MTLKFPGQYNVKLRRSPLVQVICQVRFSPILRIGSEQPHAFQEAIRHKFPNFAVEQSFSFQMPINVPSQASPSFQMAPSEFRFTTADEHTSLTLAQNFFALSTDRYTVWEEFAANLELVSNAVRAEYDPSLVLRIGLRYVNEIETEKLGFATFDQVIALVQPTLIAPLTVDAWSAPKAFATQMELDDDGSTLAIRLGLQVNDGEAPRALVLDFDYYEEGPSTLDDLVTRCDRFHAVIYDAFRWAIHEDQLSVFDPIQ